MTRKKENHARPHRGTPRGTRTPHLHSVGSVVRQSARSALHRPGCPLTRVAHLRQRGGPLAQCELAVRLGAANLLFGVGRRKRHRHYRHSRHGRSVHFAQRQGGFLRGAAHQPQPWAVLPLSCGDRRQVFAVVQLRGARCGKESRFFVPLFRRCAGLPGWHCAPRDHEGLARTP